MESTRPSFGYCEGNGSGVQGGRPPRIRRVEPRQPGREHKRRQLNTATWSLLPRDLLPLVWAHLPMPLLLSLRHSTLHVKWIHEYMNHPSLIKSCARRWESNTLCAVILKAPNSATYDVGVVHSGDSSITLAWHKLRLDRREPVNTLCSGDGGLVCFCLTVEEEGGGLQLVLGVVNPLSGACRVLPSDHGVSPFHLKMMQLVVDKSTRQYQVLLVHEEELRSISSEASPSCHEMSEEASVIEDSVNEIGIEKFREPLRGVIFDSGTSLWRNARNSSQVLLGPAIHEKRYVRDQRRRWKCTRRYHGADNFWSMDYQGSSRFFGPVAYDCSTGKVITVLDIMADPLVPYHEFALSKDCLFELLHSEAHIHECQILIGKDHLGLILVEDDYLSREVRAKMFGMLPASPLKVLACEGYLLVRGSHFEEFFHRSSYRVVGLLYDKRAGEWVDLLEGGLDRASDEDLADTQVEEEEEDPDEIEVDLPQTVVEPGRQVRVFGDHPVSFESAPIMLCNLDWEAAP